MIDHKVINNFFLSLTVIHRCLLIGTNIGFDPKSLKVAQLRGILNEHDVEYPSNAKKADLVGLFEKRISPRAAGLLAAHNEAVKNATEEGIEDASLQSEDFPKPQKKRGRPKKSMSPRAQESTPVVPQKRSQDDPPSLKKKRGSPATSEPSSTVNRSRGHLFDENSSFSDDDFFASKIKRLPAKALAEEQLSQVKEENTTPLKPRTSRRKVSAKKEAPSVEVPQFKTLKEEEDSFEQDRAKIKNRQMADLAADLGVTIHGTPPKDFSLDESSFETKPKTETPKKTPRKSAPLSEKSRKTPKESVKLTPKDNSSSKKSSAKLKSEGTPAKTPSKAGKTPTKSPSKSQTSSKTPKSASKTPAKTPSKSTPKKSPALSTKPTEKTSTDIIEELDDEEELEDIEELDETTETVQTSSRKSLLSSFLFLTLWLLVVVCGLGVFWYREQQYLIGYCGNEIDQATFPPTSHPWLVAAGTYLDANFKPKCTPCPPHARCYPYLELGCYEDFVEFQPWYFHLTPTLNTNLKQCVPDTKKAEKLEIMIDVALDLLRSRNAEKKCGRTSTDDFEAGLNSTELHDLLLMMKAPYITREEFEELWERLVVELEKEPEVIVRQVVFYSPSLEHPLTQTGLGDGIRTGVVDHTPGTQKASDKVFRSTSLSNLSLKCRALNTLIGTLVHYKGVLLSLVGLYLVVLYIRYRIHQYRLQRLRVETVYYEVLRNLKKQYKLSKDDPSVPAYVGSTQLRDLILTTEKNLTRKLKLWKRVSSEVENNTNIHYHLVEHHGEIMKVWEWISDLEVDT